MNLEFNEEKHIERMTPHVEKLIKHLSQYDITFEPTDGHLDNVIFRRGDEVHKIAHRCFYRFSGLCIMQKKNIKKKVPKKERDYIDLIHIDDDMFINIYMKEIIERLFKIN